MSRNLLSLIMVALVVVVAGGSYLLYQEQHKPAGIEIKIGDQGISIDGN